MWGEARKVVVYKRNHASLTNVYLLCELNIQFDPERHHWDHTHNNGLTEVAHRGDYSYYIL